MLGGSGMLGAMVAEVLAQDSDLGVTATARDDLRVWRTRAPWCQWRSLEATACSPAELGAALAGVDWVINAIGLIKHHIRDDHAATVERAVRINALFPHVLARAAERAGCRVIQIATDCVWAGTRGGYLETDPHDALDVYGKTKSLGEVYSPAVGHLRCSIIGPEPRGHVSLMDWFLGQPRNGSVGGYTNHQWNGVTTLHFARLCHGVIREGLELPHVQHVVPGGAISKADLLGCLAREYRRQDVTITPTEAKTVIDRTLATADEALNRRLWAAAGYAQPPAVPQMVAEMARFERRLKGGEL